MALSGQMPVVDEARRQLGRGGERRRRILDAVVRFEAALQAAQDGDGFLHRRLGHVDLLETARQGVIFLEYAAVFVVGGRADALQLPGGERGFEQVGRVQGPAGCGARADQRMDFVDEQDRVAIVQQLLQHRFQALLEIAAIFGAGEQCAHVQRIHLAARQHLRHVTFDDAPRQAFGDGGLAHAGFAHQQRIVLAPPAQRLDHPFQFAFAADERIDFADQRLGVQIQRVGFERAVAGLIVLLFLGLSPALHPGVAASW